MSDLQKGLEMSEADDNVIAAYCKTEGVEKSVYGGNYWSAGCVMFPDHIDLPSVIAALINDNNKLRALIKDLRSDLDEVRMGE